MLLSVGRIVHYVTITGTHRPALVLDDTGENEFVIRVFQPGGDTERIISQDDEDAGTYKAKSWHWPERG